MSDTIRVRSTRGYELTFTDGTRRAVRRIGRGRFTTAYKADDPDDPAVWLIVNEASGDYSKEILSQCSGPYFPELERIGETAAEHAVYRTRYYPRPSAKLTPAAWKEYRVLASALAEARSEVLTLPEFRKYPQCVYAGHTIMIHTAANLRAAGRPDLSAVVFQLADAAGQFGSSYTLEIAPRNLGTEDGRLILTDPIFDQETVTRQDNARIRRARGY